MKFEILNKKADSICVKNADAISKNAVPEVPREDVIPFIEYIISHTTHVVKHIFSVSGSVFFHA